MKYDIVAYKYARASSMLQFTADLCLNSFRSGDRFFLQKTSKSGKIDIKCNPHAGINKGYAAFDSYRVLPTLREEMRT